MADIAEQVDYEAVTPIFDAVMSRPDGPLVLLNRLHDLITAAQETSKAGVQRHNEPFSGTARPHGAAAEKMRKTRDLSRELRSRKPPA